MHKVTKTLLAGAVVLAAGCTQFQETTGLGDKATTGAAVGAATGGVLGAVLGEGSGWALGGAILGGLAGAYIGDQMDQRDKELAGQASERAVLAGSAGETAQWDNDESGNSGEVVINDVYTDANGRLCKDFTETVTLDDGTVSRIDGTACQLGDGTWEMVKA